MKGDLESHPKELQGKRAGGRPVGSEMGCLKKVVGLEIQKSGSDFDFGLATRDRSRNTCAPNYG